MSYLVRQIQKDLGTPKYQGVLFLKSQYLEPVNTHTISISGEQPVASSTLVAFPPASSLSLGETVNLSLKCLFFFPETW